MKTASKELFKLIKSLSPSEKRHFKLSANNDSKKSYMRLFELIDSQKNYNEKLILQKLQNDPIVRNIKKWKMYISEVILKSLETYHHTDDAESIIERELQRVRILQTRGLQKQAENHIKKVRKLAADKEKPEYFACINKLEVSNLTSDPNINKIKKYLHNEAIDTIKSAKSVINIINYRNLMLEFTPFTVKTKFETSKKNEELRDRIIRHPLMTSTTHADTFLSQHLYQSIHTMYLISIDKWNEVDYIRQKKWIEYMETEKSILSDRALFYLSAINSILITLSYIIKSGELEYYFSKALNFSRHIPVKIKNSRGFQAMLSTVINNYIQGQLKQSRPEKAIEAWDYMQDQGLDIVRSKYSNIFLYFNLLYAYFLLKEYRKALYFANKIMADKNFINSSHRAGLNIYLLLLHYELGNYEVLSYMAKSARRYQLKNKNISEYDKLILYYFERKLSETIDINERKKIFSGWKMKLSRVPKKSVLYNGTDVFFDFITWLDSKIENRPFAEIVIEKIDAIKG